MIDDELKKIKEDIPEISSFLNQKIYKKYLRINKSKININYKFLFFAPLMFCLFLIVGIGLIFSDKGNINKNLIYGTQNELNFDYLKLSTQKNKVLYSSDLLTNIVEDDNLYYKVIVYYYVTEKDYPDLYETKFNGYTIEELYTLKEVAYKNYWQTKDKQYEEQFDYYNSLYNQANKDFNDLCSKAEYDFFVSIGAKNIENYTGYKNRYYIMEVNNVFFDKIKNGKGIYYISLVPEKISNIDIMNNRYGEYILGDCVYQDIDYMLSSVAVLSDPASQLYGTISLSEDSFESNLKARYQANYWFILNSYNYTNFKLDNNFQKIEKNSDNYYGIFDDRVYLLSKSIINNLINSEVYIIEDQYIEGNENTDIVYVLYLGAEHSYFGIMRKTDSTRGPYKYDKIFEIYRKEDLYCLYPEYNNLDVSNGLDIYVGIEQVSENSYIQRFCLSETPKNNSYLQYEELNSSTYISKFTLFAILSTYNIDDNKIRIIYASYPFKKDYYLEELTEEQKWLYDSLQKFLLL